MLLAVHPLRGARLAPNKRKILEAARKYAQKGAKDRALKEYEKLLKLDPRDAKLRLEIGDAHRRWGQVDEAVNAYRRVAEQYMDEGFDARAVAVLKQIQNLDPEALHGIGDKVLTFDDFDLDVRKELVEEPAQRLGGVGSFEDLLKQLTDNGDASEPMPNKLEDLGWDSSLGDIANINFGASGDSEGPSVDENALAAALAAFGAAGLGASTP